MAARRYVHEDWILDLGHDPADPPIPAPEPPAPEVTEAVASALLSLTDDERQFIERFYFMGQTYREMAETSGRTTVRLESLRHSALTKLKQKLGPFVRERYGLVPAVVADCPICRSPHREEIESLVRRKREQDTWRPTIGLLRDRYGIDIKSPQTILGHLKHH